MDGSWVEEASIDSLQFCIADDALHRMGSGLSVVLDLVPKEGGGGGGGGGMEVESRKLQSSKYKGVVPQPNGRWGAQIYERHLRVWLGTFAAETEAARAYDVAAQRFRGREAATNLGTLAESDEEEAAELSFLGAHSKAEIVDMLRKHTYLDELEHCKRGGGATAVKRKSPAGGCRQSPSPREMLFEKTVTPSDVGKLNRLVIPKQHAEKHFPARINGGSGKGVLLHLEDADGKMWRFRYTYWHSSQSYVLTKGWSRFVKEKQLRAGDVVSFWRSAGPENQLYVEWQSGRRAEPPAVRLFGVNISKKQFIQVL